MDIQLVISEKNQYTFNSPTACTAIAMEACLRWLYNKVILTSEGVDSILEDGATLYDSLNSNNHTDVDEVIKIKRFMNLLKKESELFYCRDGIEEGIARIENMGAHFQKGTNSCGHKETSVTAIVIQTGVTRAIIYDFKYGWIIFDSHCNDFGQSGRGSGFVFFPDKKSLIEYWNTTTMKNAFDLTILSKKKNVNEFVDFDQYLDGLRVEETKVICDAKPLKESKQTTTLPSNYLSESNLQLYHQALSTVKQSNTDCCLEKESTFQKKGKVGMTNNLSLLYQLEKLFEQEVGYYSFVVSNNTC